MSSGEMSAYFAERLEDRILDTVIAHGQLTITVEPDALNLAARLCKGDPRLDFDFFDFMSGIDLAEQGIAVLTHLYSIRHGHHIQLRAIADGGREAPTLPTITDVYRGANWHEREAYDMFGVVFTDHPGLEPRILTVENFEGWPLRKEFLLSTRQVKPWPGNKEPKDPEEVAEESGAQAPRGPSAEEKAAAAKEKAERAKRKAAEMRAKKAKERAEARESEDAPTTGAAGGPMPPDQVPPEDSDTEEYSQQVGTETHTYEAARESGGETPGGPAQRSGAPGVEEEGRHTGAVEQSGDRSATETPGMTSPTQDAEAGPAEESTPAPGPESDVADAAEPGTDAVPGDEEQADGDTDSTNAGTQDTENTDEKGESG